MIRILKRGIDCQLNLNKLKKSEKYQKCDPKLYKIIVKRHEIALKNAEQAQKQNNESKNYPNPSTQFIDLIRFLSSLKENSLKECRF